ncbi:MAG: hypothetical protein Kow00128_18250 [Deltaproteobacteria bacterium]
MPLYEYRCGKCDRVFEAYKRSSEDSERERCPACGEVSSRLGISLFRAGSAGECSSAGGSSCGSGPRRSPFG